MAPASATWHAGRLRFLDGGGKLIELQLHFVELAADLMHVAEAALFQFPLLSKVGKPLAKVGHLLLDILAALLGVLLGLFGKLPIGKLKLHQPPLDFVVADLLRHALPSSIGQAAGRLVHEVDRFVR